MPYSAEFIFTLIETQQVPLILTWVCVVSCLSVAGEVGVGGDGLGGGGGVRVGRRVGIGGRRRGRLKQVEYGVVCVCLQIPFDPRTSAFSRIFNYFALFFKLFLKL